MTDIRSRKIARYGWRPDLPDARDHLFAPNTHFGSRFFGRSLPSSIDLRAVCPPVYDQGQVGSCTANAIAGAIQFARKRQGWAPDFVPSRLFIYYNERKMEGDVGQDNGAQIRDGVKSVAQLGVCPETEWLYLPAAQLFRPPSPKAYADALKYKVTSYARVVNAAANCQACLADGYPFVFGFTVYDSFESDAVAKSGVVPMPNLQTEQVLGGHAVMAVGYDAAKEVYICRNSWGPNCGQAGYFTMPFAYVNDARLASDFWTIRLESA